MKHILSLATKHEDLCCPSPEVKQADAATKVTYPTVWLRDIKGLDKLPEGEFTATVKFKKTHSSEEKRTENGKTVESYSATLDLLSLEFDAAKGEAEDDGPQDAESALDGFLKSSQPT